MVKAWVQVPVRVPWINMGENDVQNRTMQSHVTHQALDYFRTKRCCLYRKHAKQRTILAKMSSSVVEMASARWERVRHPSLAQRALDATRTPTVTKPFAVPNAIRKNATIAGLSCTSTCLIPSISSQLCLVSLLFSVAMFARR